MRPNSRKLLLFRNGIGASREFGDALPVFITADMDPANERDDESAVACWLATQDIFNIVGFAADSPDGDIDQWNLIVDAYWASAQELKAQTPYPERFKTADALKALGIQGPTNNTVSAGATNDSPAKGFWEPADAGYAQAHASAQAIIQAARTYGKASGGPRDKLWIVVQGAFCGFVQACYEAIVLGEQPDFLRRVHVVGQPNFNSWAAPNTWNYLVANSWPSDSDPGLFGDLWLLAGYFKWHAHNRNNGTTDTTFWNTVITRGDMGQFLEDERAVSSVPQTYFRAGDAGSWFWMVNAYLNDSFDPTDTSNPACVVAYQTYVGELWAAQTFGYGAGSGINTGNPNPEHTWWNETAWAPPLSVNDNTTDAYASINMTTWYEQAGEAMERYDTANTTATEHLYLPGTRRAAFKLTGSAVVNEDTDAQYTLSWIGPAITTDVVVTLDEVNEGNMSSLLEDDLAAIVQTGVSASGKTLTISSSATSPVVFNRTPDDTVSGERQYDIWIEGVSAGGFVPDVVTTEIADVGVAEITFIGGSGGIIPANTNADVSLPAGTATGDIVIVVTGSDGGWTGTMGSPTTAGYTALHHALTGSPSAGCFYKVMGGTPDSVVNIEAGTSGTGITVSIATFRGIDTADPIAVAMATATAASGAPNPPSRTLSANQMSVIFGVTEDDVVSSVTAPTDWSNLVWRHDGTANACQTTMIASRLITADAAYDPAAFTVGVSDDWIAGHFALRPAP